MFYCARLLFLSFKYSALLKCSGFTTLKWSDVQKRSIKSSKCLKCVALDLRYHNYVSDNLSFLFYQPLSYYKDSSTSKYNVVQFFLCTNLITRCLSIHFVLCIHLSWSRRNFGRSHRNVKILFSRKNSESYISFTRSSWWQVLMCTKTLISNRIVQSN